MKYGSPKHALFVFVTYGMPIMYCVASLKFIKWDNIEGLLIAIGLYCVAYFQYSCMIGQERFEKEPPPPDVQALRNKEWLANEKKTYVTVKEREDAQRLKDEPARLEREKARLEKEKAQAKWKELDKLE